MSCLRKGETEEGLMLELDERQADYARRCAEVEIPAILKGTLVEEVWVGQIVAGEAPVAAWKTTIGCLRSRIEQLALNVPFEGQKSYLSGMMDDGSDIYTRTEEYAAFVGVHKDAMLADHEAVFHAAEAPLKAAAIAARAIQDERHAAREAEYYADAARDIARRAARLAARRR